MGGNSTTAAIGTMAGVPGISGASIWLPGALDALAAELQARSSAGAGREPIRMYSQGPLAQKSEPAKVSPRAAVDGERPLREADVSWPIFGGHDVPAMLASDAGSGPWWAGSLADAKGLQAGPMSLPVEPVQPSLLENCRLVQKFPSPDGGWQCLYSCPITGDYVHHTGPGQSCPQTISKPGWLG